MSTFLAMVFYSRLDCLDGGGGCTEFLLSRTSSKGLLAKVLLAQLSVYCHLKYVTAIGNQDITCAPAEYVTVIPPNGSTCANYMQQYISQVGGYLTNPDATSNCQFCQYRTTDEFLGNSFNILYSHRWRDIGIVLGITVFNVSRDLFF